MIREGGRANHFRAERGREEFEEGAIGLVQGDRDVMIAGHFDGSYTACHIGRAFTDFVSSIEGTLNGVGREGRPIMESDPVAQLECEHRVVIARGPVCCEHSGELGLSLPWDKPQEPFVCAVNDVQF